jgi:uncharacterized membrane protein YeaQ/YmgE (transglycosylase-associated protein family)
VRHPAAPLVEGSFFHPAGFVLSVIGAIIVLVLWQHFM